MAARTTASPLPSRAVRGGGRPDSERSAARPDAPDRHDWAAAPSALSERRRPGAERGGTMAAALAAAVAAALGALLLAPGRTLTRGEAPAAGPPPPLKMDQALLLVRNELPAQGLRLAARSAACHRVSAPSRAATSPRPAARFASPSASSAVLLPASGRRPAERREPGRGGRGGHPASAQPAAQRLPGRQRALQVGATAPALRLCCWVFVSPALRLRFIVALQPLS